jgi:hypothetical protein
MSWGRLCQGHWKLPTVPENVACYCRLEVCKDGALLTCISFIIFFFAYLYLEGLSAGLWFWGNTLKEVASHMSPMTSVSKVEAEST